MPTGGEKQRVLPRAEPRQAQPLRQQDIQDRGPRLQGEHRGFYNNSWQFM